MAGRSIASSLRKQFFQYHLCLFKNKISRIQKNSVPIISILKFKQKFTKRITGCVTTINCYISLNLHHHPARYILSFYFPNGETEAVRLSILAELIGRLRIHKLSQSEFSESLAIMLKNLQKLL